MGINGIELERFSVGRFGDLRLEKGGVVPRGVGGSAGLMYS